MKNILISLLALSFLGCSAQEAEKTENGWFNFFNKSTLVQENQVLPAPVKPKVGVINLIGDFDILQALVLLTTAAKNKEISAILLVIDCDGGSFAPFSALHDLIKKVRVKKPIVGLVIGSAYSGGYLVTSATNYIIAQSGSEFGSIGVIFEIYKYKEPKVTGNIDAKLEVELFTAGEYKGILNRHKNFTEQERAYLKTYVEKGYELFLKTVAENRNLDLQNYKTWADGKVHFAPDALQMGLIDGIGTIFEAENKLLELIIQKNPDLIYDNEVEYLFYDFPKENNNPK
jgi:signal peptide peptidase SppA